MTGYGRSNRAEGQTLVDVEARSVNNRYLKLVLSLPDGLTPHQAALERVVRDHLARGTLNLSVRVRSESVAPAAVIDATAAAHYEGQLEAVSAELGISGDLALKDLLALPGVLVERAPEPMEARLVALVTETLRRALEELVEARVAEGNRLRAALEERLLVMRDLRSSLRELAEGAPERLRQRLEERLRALLAEVEDAPIDEGALAREVALLAEKADVTEELVRLEAHIERFGDLLAVDRPLTEACGRELDFLTQEMLREANTMASKAPGKDAVHQVVALKGEIEKLKEQVQNVE